MMTSTAQPVSTPSWARRWLIAAGLYNLVWGAVVVVFPHLLFDLAGIERTNYPSIWQCVGMVVGVYGIGYLLAADDPRRHWPIVLVGLLGKIFGPIGFMIALGRGEFPPLFALTILTNDLIWWIPFVLILRDAAKNRARPETAPDGCQHFVAETRIAASPESVFRFHESADARRQLIPPWEKMTVAESDGSLQRGSRVVLRGRLGPIQVEWVAEHTAYDRPHLFADRQESGPFAWWYHRHRFIDDGSGGTILRDEVDYKPPLGVIGNWLGGWLIRRKLKQMFDYRHQATREILEREDAGHGRSDRGDGGMADEQCA